MTTALTIDHMELADVGARPDKLAGEVLRQLRAQWGELPLPIPLHELAEALGIEKVEERNTTSFDGALVASADRARGVIVLREGLRKGRRNFTFGHELGHFVNPYHKPPPGGFQCSSRGLAQRRQGNVPWKERPPEQRMEVEANEFSSHLLVPRAEFQVEMKRRGGCDIGHVVELADRFAVSKEMMAQLYIAEVAEKIGIIVSKNGEFTRCVLPVGFPYLGLQKGQSLPARSLTREFARTHHAGQMSELSLVSSDVWLDRSARGVEVYEQVLLQVDGWAMTLLALEDESGDEDEEALVERSWYEPKFSYRR